MWQQYLALFVVAFFIIRLIRQKRGREIIRNEFIFWLFFWLLVGLAVIFIKTIDRAVTAAGFSSTGINVLLYLGVAWLFYLVFKTRLKIGKLEKDITKIAREMALRDKNDKL